MLSGLMSKLRQPGPGEALPGRPEPIKTAATHYVNGRPLKGPYPPGIVADAGYLSINRAVYRYRF